MRPMWPALLWRCRLEAAAMYETLWLNKKPSFLEQFNKKGGLSFNNLLVHNCLAYKHKKNLLRNQRTKNRLTAKGPFTWLSLTLKKWQNERHVLTPLADFIEESRSRISNILKANLHHHHFPRSSGKVNIK